MWPQEIIMKNNDELQKHFWNVDLYQNKFPPNKVMQISMQWRKSGYLAVIHYSSEWEWPGKEFENFYLRYLLDL